MNSFDVWAMNHPTLGVLAVVAGALIFSLSLVGFAGLMAHLILWIERRVSIKHFQYAKYLARHKWFVLMAGLRNGAPLWQLIIHDWSKLLPCEWIAYSDYFFGEKARLQREEPDDAIYWELAAKYYRAFDHAWLHHIHANPHHWEHWVLRKATGESVPLEMPERFVREMVSDWCGAGRAITGKWDVVKWYSENAHKIQLHEATQLRVLGILKAWVSE